MKVVKAPFDSESVKNIKYSALVLLRRPEGFSALDDWMRQCERNDWHAYLNAINVVWGVGLALKGEISAGLRWIETSISRQEREGAQTNADWQRIYLCELYIEIIAGSEKPSLYVLARNAITILVVLLTAEQRVVSLVGEIRRNPHLDPNGFHIGRCEMILGLLYKAKKKRPLAVQHLTEAKRIISQFGPSPTLTKIESALAEMGPAG